MCQQFIQGHPEPSCTDEYQCFAILLSIPQTSRNKIPINTFHKLFIFNLFCHQDNQAPV